MERAEFEDLVANAVGDLPGEFLSQLENIDVVVQDSPTRRQLADVGPGMTLLGLYEGIPHTERTRAYSMALPDKIIIFQKPIESRCRSKKEIAEEVQSVVRHEIAHHFGFDDDSLRRIEARKGNKRGPHADH